MKRILGFSLVAAAVLALVADTAEARFGRRRARHNCCASACNNGCAPQGMAYYNGQDPNMSGPSGAVPPPPQPNTTFYRGNPDQAPNQGQPRMAPGPQGRVNSQGTVDQDGIRSNTKGAIEQNN
jgi:hypothetical protein